MERIELTREKANELIVTNPQMILDLLFSLIEEVAQLRRQVDQNSHNSSKPPSSDGYKKPAPKSQREKSGKPSGGQPGHKGHHLAVVDHPDRIVKHIPSACQHCGYEGIDLLEKSFERRQVTDLKIFIETTEHQAYVIQCPCCQQLTESPFPDNVPFLVQYGPTMKSFLSYSDVYQLIPSKRLREMVHDFTGHSVSEGTLFNTNSALYKNLEVFEKKVKQSLVASDVANVDETGIKVNGKTHWLHSIGTKQLTHYAIHKKRGKVAMDDMGILPNFSGVAVHDGWKPYQSYVQCTHALCNAHHLRELQAVIDHEKQPWAKDMIDLLCTINNAVQRRKEQGFDQLPPEQITDFETRYEALLQCGFAKNPPPAPPSPDTRKRGRLKKSKTRNLLERLDQHRHEVLLFMYDFKVPFTNNLAEQDVRMTKVQQKISGTFRSIEGAKTYCRIRGYISTLKKNGLPVFEFIQKAFDGNPYIPHSNP